MPYSASNPPQAVKGLPKHAQAIYIAAFNSAMKQYKDEKRAHATAWAAVSKRYTKQSDGQWVLKYIIL
jgi:cation transport regulator